jgi:transcription elongation factor Elf1
MTGSNESARIVLPGIARIVLPGIADILKRVPDYKKVLSKDYVHSDKRHQRNGRPPALFRCHACCYTTPDRSNLGRHVRKHSHSRYYQCPFCGLCSVQSCNVKTHCINKHGVDIAFGVTCVNTRYDVTKDGKKVNVIVGSIPSNSETSGQEGLSVHSLEEVAKQTAYKFYPSNMKISSCTVCSLSLPSHEMTECKACRGVYCSKHTIDDHILLPENPPDQQAYPILP